MRKGFFSSIISAQRFKKKRAVTSEEFVYAMEADFNRKLDENSALFFRHHSISTNLVHRILTGQIKATGTEADPVVLNALLLDMTGYLVGVEASELGKINKSKSISERFGATLEAFSKTYPDAGNIIAQATEAYFKLR